ncbi:SDR family oxidoreductase [Nocardia aurantiaca]|uniref:SDR family oxidoreductase n=1 Tax=Nocardia aurantiaca TaxID=2675850 RepID=A0A6I3KW73_9NOCA|nr:SDR family oxidoreductase [Nocardia aurantiaca]MTE15083.1 SDR family oxidoreductase [Nocardia aurantiaca]
MSLDGQHVVILGGTSGIGYAVAAATAAQGAKVTVVSSRRDRVDRAVAGLPAGTSGVVADLNDIARIRSVFDELGTLDHLVYTAGEPLLLSPVADLDLEAARTFFELRYFSVLAAVQAAAPRLRAEGSITLTTGTAGPRPLPGSAVTSSVCGAVEALTRALAVELAPIRVNAVMPGVVRSPLWNFPDDLRDRFYSDTAAATPLRRIAEVDDIARAFVFFLAQPHATGSVLPLDGGAVLA